MEIDKSPKSHSKTPKYNIRILEPYSSKISSPDESPDYLNNVSGSLDKTNSPVEFPKEKIMTRDEE